MQLRSTNIIPCVGGLMIILLNTWGCIKPYNPNLHSPATGYLVVEGNINSAPATTTITLSRSVPLADTASEVFENGATATVECSDGTTYPATFGGSGTYNFGVIPLDSTKTYRLFIQTADQNQYYSEYVKVIPNPPIDSISLVLNGNGAKVNVNTHNPDNNTRYYTWNYAETWEYHSAEESFYIYKWDSGVVLRTPAELVYTCYRSDVSTSLLIYSTAKLSQDVVSQFTLVPIPEGDQRLAVEYSILVNQYALADSAYDYLQLMQSNTESLGSIFDPLPSSLTGNIRCTTNPSLQVVGFVNASAVQTVRTFFPSPIGWPYYYECTQKDTTLPGDTDLVRNFGSTDFTPIEMGIPGSDTWVSNLTSCIDCTAQGGTTIKPSFWP